MVIQSDPFEESPYAKVEPSSENLNVLIETVPSSDKALGSKNTLGSEFKSF